MPNPAARFSEYAPAQINAISLAATFQIGLITDIAQRCDKLNIKYQMDDTIRPIINPVITPPQAKLIQPECNYNYRDYQVKAIAATLKYGRGLIVSPTASGKSLIMYGIIKNAVEYQQTTLIIVPGTQLVTQLDKDFIEYGSDFHCTFSSETKTIPENTKVIISNREWLQGHASELPKIHAIMIDEVHKLKPKSKMYKTVKSIKTNYLLGFTGTMPEQIADQWFVKSAVGPIIFEEETHKLQAQNYLSQINIISLFLEHTQLHRFPMETYEDIQKLYYNEYKYLEQDDKSNLTIVSIIEKFSKLGNTLVIFDHTCHGEFLRDHTKGNVYFINGETPMADRENIRALMETRNDIILYANEKCFGTGINVKNIKNVVIASHGKGLTKIIQLIGRGLRKISASVETMNLVDIHHNYKYSLKHFNERLQLYRRFYKKSYDKRKRILVSNK